MDVSRSAPAIMPGPPPLLGGAGNILRFMTGPRAYLERLHRDYGEVAAIARGSTAYISGCSSEYNQRVLSDTATFYNLDAESSPLRMRPDSALSRLYNGLINMNGARHSQQRHILAHAFQRPRIERYCAAITALTERQIDGWRPGQERDMLREMQQLTMAIAVKTLLGLEPDAEGAAIARALQRWMALVFSVPALALPWPIPGLPYHRLQQLSEQLERAIRAMIERRRASDADAPDVLSLLLHAHDQDGAVLSDDELIGQTSFLFMAGYSTTSSVLAWTLLLLAQHPAVLHSLLDELDARLHGAAPTVQQLAELPLLDDVIKESMRLLPSVMWWSRISAQPFSLGPYELPRGARVIYSPYITHRRPELYAQPRRFLPERWRTIAPGPYEYIPFSAGPRACLGAGFALMELKVALALIVQRFRLTLRPGARVDYGGLMLSQPQPGLPMRIAAQDRRLAASPLRGTIAELVEPPAAGN